MRHLRSLTLLFYSVLGIVIIIGVASQFVSLSIGLGDVSMMTSRGGYLLYFIHETNSPNEGQYYVRLSQPIGSFSDGGFNFTPRQSGGWLYQEKGIWKQGALCESVLEIPHWGLVAIFAAPVLISMLVRRQLRPISADACTGCGYCLNGLSIGRCPECGRRFEKANDAIV